MGRAPGERASTEGGLNKGPWTEEEDAVLAAFIKAHGEGNWRTLPKRAGLQRCRKSCRLRWMNYLRPDLKRGNFSPDEDELIIKLHSLLGNRWSMIAGRIPGRTDNEIKNYWNSRLRRKLADSGDPVEASPLSFDTPKLEPATESDAVPDHKHNLFPTEVTFPEYTDALAGRVVDSAFFDHADVPSEPSSDGTCALEDSCDHYYSAWTPALDEDLSQAISVKRELYAYSPESVLFLPCEDLIPEGEFSSIDHFGYNFDTGAGVSDSFGEVMNVHKVALQSPVAQKNLVWPGCCPGDGFW